MDKLVSVAASVEGGTPGKTGLLLPLTEDTAMTPEIVWPIAAIHEFRGHWKAIEHFARPQSWRRIATIESIGSSLRIEGARLSDAEVEKVITAGPPIPPFATREDAEAAGYADALNEILGPRWESLNEYHIKGLHRLLLRHNTNDASGLGEYKKVASDLEAIGRDGARRVIFQAASPAETPMRMTEMVDWYNEALHQGDEHPLSLIGKFVARFLSIQPFEHGNGHLSRLLTTLLLLLAGYDYVPYSSIEKLIESDKHRYYNSLLCTLHTIATDEPDWSPWLRFFLKTLEKQTDNLAEKIENEQSLRTELPALSRRILALARDRGEISIIGIERNTRRNRNTIKAHVKKLCASGYLRQVGKGRGARYILNRS